MKKYKLICKKGEGTFSEVVKAENIEDGKEYAIKCMKSTYDDIQQVNNLREIQALKRLSPHPNIIHLEEVLFDKPSGRLAMVFELMDANLYDLISGRREHLDHELVLSLGYQMFIALQHMHDNGIFHRDIKPENILVDPKGKSLKLADLGSCRSINSSPPMTEYIATRWYRSPECLLTDGHYGPEMDIWGAGCVLFEIIALFPLFPGSDEVDQVNRIHKVVGTPKPDVLDKLKVKGSSKINYKFSKMKGIGIKHFIPHASPFCVDLLTQTMIYAIEDRMTAEEAVNHDYFSKLREEDVNNTGKTKTRNNTSTKGKQSTKRYARVEPDHPSAANDKKQAAAKKKVNKTKLETKKSTDSNRSKKGNLKFRSAKHTEKLSSIKTNLRKTNNAKIAKNKLFIEKESASAAARRRRLAGEKVRLQKGGPKKENKLGTTAATTLTGKQSKKKRSKYSSVQSSGYGRGKATLQTTKSNKKVNQQNSKKKPTQFRSKMRRKDETYDSAGTGATATTTPPGVAKSNTRINRLQKNKISLLSGSEDGDGNNPILPAIRA